MPVDDRDERAKGTTPEGVGPPAPGDTGTPPSAQPARRSRWRRYVTRRNALYVALVAVVGAFVLALLAVFLYRTGRVDALISRQIISTLAQYGIRAEVKEFHTALGPRTVQIKGLALYDAQTGARLGRIDTIIA